MNDKYNASHVPDPTAYAAIKNDAKQTAAECKRLEQLLTAFARKWGFDITYIKLVYRGRNG